MIDVKALVQEKKDAVRAAVERRGGARVKLSILQVGNDPASTVYVDGKLRDCKEVGIEGDVHRFPATANCDEILDCIRTLNADDACRGIILQLPLPERFSAEEEQKLLSAIDLAKDVDGFRGDSPFTPCTPRGILSILQMVAEKRGWDGLAGKTVCVIGRSRIVGKPTAELLIDRGCTVISCNSHTVDLDRFLAMADIIVCAVGKAGFLHPARKVDFSDKVIVDVGINRMPDGKICGDCDPALYKTVEWITPVPGGVGLMTRASLLANTLELP